MEGLVTTLTVFGVLGLAALGDQAAERGSMKMQAGYWLALTALLAWLLIVGRWGSALVAAVTMIPLGLWLHRETRQTATAHQEGQHVRSD